MDREEMFKLALFMVIRNSKILPRGLELGKTSKEINKMTIETMNECINMIDYDIARQLYLEGVSDE